MKNTEDTNRTRIEALALRYTWTLGEEDRPRAVAELNKSTVELVGLMSAVNKTLAKNPGITWADVLDMLERRPNLQGEAAAIEDAEVDLLAGYDTDHLTEAYNTALEDFKKISDQRRLETAEKKLAQAKDAKTPAQRGALIDDAVAALVRAEAANEESLAEAWDRHRESLKADVADPKTVLRLNEKRGPWAAWFNDWLGPRAGLERGQTFILGGAPEAGKTSLASVLAVDALAAGCPVLFWQLELGREETLEHLQAQHPDPAGWWKEHFWSRAHRALPGAWEDLLTVPQSPSPEAEAIKAAMLDQARKCERARRAKKICHACNGLVIVDYAQLLTLADKGPGQAQHEILATAASRLAKAAGDCGAVLLILSQLNKVDQNTGVPTGTALAGADLARMAHRVALVNKATSGGKVAKTAEDVDADDEKGEARLVTWVKARGKRYSEDGRPPIVDKVIWSGGQSRAWHGGEDEQPKYKTKI